MEWEDRQESSNVEDRRGMSGPAIGGVAGGGGAILLLILGLVFGIPRDKLPDVLNQPERQRPSAGGRGATDPREEKLKRFASVILHDTEVIWTEQFSKQGYKAYRPTTIVLFTGQVDSGCGPADSGVGPFYCPADRKVYLDLGFFEELERKLGAPGEFARAYVIAHEVGHHVQNQLGYSARADAKRGTKLEKQYSVRLELQADYLAGVWAHHLQKTPGKKPILNQADVKSGLNAAAKIGDDYLQKRATGRFRPESFTHGYARARATWLSDGLETGDCSKERLDRFFTDPYDKVNVGP